MSTSKNETHRLWQGRSSGEVDPIMVRMGQSIDLDIKIYKEDLTGSAAHARMLASVGIITENELGSILTSLDQIRREIEEGNLELRHELEDIHTHIENRLVELIGDTGKKLHTARSRNDQVAVDTHLNVIRSSAVIAGKLCQLCGSLLERARESTDIVLPGYTHLQVAQPVRLSHHLLSHFWAFLRDAERFLRTAEYAKVLPLGSGAMAGVNYSTDREMLKNDLGFHSVYPNSMDAVSSRDHILEFLHSCSVFAVHASRISEEIILWNSVEFSFIELPDFLTTGSSIMPQKKNPDLAELSRGKTGRIIGNHINLLINIKGLPLTYNRDLQEDRQPLLDSAEQLNLILDSLTSMITYMVFKKTNMSKSLEAGFATATDLADALVQKRGIPFREAHHFAGKLVAVCSANHYFLSNVPRELRAEIHEALADDSFYFPAIDLPASADKKVSYGGTALFRQEEQIKEAAARLTAVHSSVNSLQIFL